MKLKVGVQFFISIVIFFAATEVVLIGRFVRFKIPVTLILGVNQFLLCAKFLVFVWIVRYLVARYRMIFSPCSPWSVPGQEVPIELSPPNGRVRRGFGEKEIPGWNVLHGPKEPLWRSRFGPKTEVGGALGSNRVPRPFIAIVGLGVPGPLDVFVFLLGGVTLLLTLVYSRFPLLAVSFV